MKFAKYLTFIPLFIWVFLYTILVGILVYFTKMNFLIALVFLPIFCLFDIFWWALVMNEKKALDTFTIFSFLVVLNFPAYWLAKKSREYLIANEIQKTGNAKNLIHPELDVEYDLLPDWEKEILTRKKNKSTSVKKNAKYLIDPLFELQRNIIKAYGQYCLYNVLKKHPKITQTFEITKLVFQEINQKEQNLSNFVNEYNSWIKLYSLDLQKYPKIGDFKKHITVVLKDTSNQEIFVSYKENRVDNTIYVRQKIQREEQKK